MESSERRDSARRIPRRRFLQGSTATVAVATFGPLIFFAGAGARADGTKFSRSYFDDRKGRFFHIDDGAWQSVELIEVMAYHASARVEQFTVTFRGSPHVAIEEGLYDVAPPTGSPFQLHIQPAGADEIGCYYDASFSIIKPISPSCASPV